MSKSLYEYWGAPEPATTNQQHKPVYAWVRDVPVERGARQQVFNVARLPFLHHHVAVMPDVHSGKGATVGTVIATDRALIPAAVGVDIGCGMVAALTNLCASDLPDNLRAMRLAIEAAVPHGRSDNGGPNDRGAWDDPPPAALGTLATVTGRGTLADRLAKLVEKHPRLSRSAARAAHHAGTLGTGNHFIEVCLDEAQQVWVMLHSGSRGIGNRIGSYFIELAKHDMRRWFINLPDDDLAYLPEGSQHFADYVEAVHWAQEFAAANRRMMLNATLLAMQNTLGRRVWGGEEAVNCHHNYVAKEHHFGANVWVTRKGAVRARQGDLGVIPGSMGARSYIVRGLGNPDSFCTCSHGAGRVMSRTAASRTFTLEDHAAATAHVECRKDADMLDETPGAYKDIDAVMAAQADLVEVVHTLRQVVCVKG